MKVKLLTGSPEAWVELEASAYLLVKLCKSPDCGKEFDTPDPRKEYCSYECQAHASYRRWQLK